MEYYLVGPDLYMDKVGSLYERKENRYVPVQSKEAQAELRYIERHKGGKDDEKV